jgi:DNA modification methylase
LLEKNLVHVGDCLELMQQIEYKSIDMILCDLPYGTTACKWDIVIPFEPLWEQYERIIKDNGAIVLFGSEPFSSNLRLSNIKNYKYDWIWNKIQSTGFALCNKQPMRSYETISVFYKKQPVYNPQMIKKDKILDTTNWKNDGKSENASFSSKVKIKGIREYSYPKNVITINAASKECNGTKRVHPTQKPIELCEYLIKTYTNEGELVLDNCIGSGTTAIACINTNRDFIGIEKELKYVQISNQRIQDILRES